MSEEGTQSSIGTKEPIEGVTLPAALLSLHLHDGGQATSNKSDVTPSQDCLRQQEGKRAAGKHTLQALQRAVQASSQLTVVSAEEDETKFAKSLNYKIHLFCQFQMSAGGCAALR